MELPITLDVSDNFRLIKVLPDVPPVVPLDLYLGVHLRVLTSSDLTWVIPTHPRSIWLIYVDLIKRQEKSLWWGGGADLHLTFTWPSPDLDRSSTILLPIISAANLSCKDVIVFSCSQSRSAPSVGQGDSISAAGPKLHIHVVTGVSSTNWWRVYSSLSSCHKSVWACSARGRQIPGHCQEIKPQLTNLPRILYWN